MLPDIVAELRQTAAADAAKIQRFRRFMPLRFAPNEKESAMRRLHITILDLVNKGPAKRLFARLMNANLASIMPQVVGAWCEELGHRVHYVCYTGFEDLGRELGGATDVLFISAFSRSAQTAYAISNLYRNGERSTVSVGPIPGSYPEEAIRPST